MTIVDLLKHISMFFVVIGCLNWGLHTIDIDLVEYVREFFEQHFGTTVGDLIANIIYMTVAVAGVYVVFHEYGIEQL